MYNKLKQILYLVILILVPLTNNSPPLSLSLSLIYIYIYERERERGGVRPASEPMLLGHTNKVRTTCAWPPS